MKKVLFILIFLISTLVLAQNDCLIDTTYHKNGKIKSVYEYNRNTHKYCGLYTSFDTSGVILSEGKYRSIDSVECFKCFTKIYNTSPEKWEQYYITKFINGIPIGEWRYYHNNGQLKEKGNYCDVVHEYQGMEYPIAWEGKSWPEPVGVYLTFEYLKNGIWEYYDINSNNIRTEEYVCGQLVFLFERN